MSNHTYGTSRTTNSYFDYSSMYPTTTTASTYLTSITSEDTPVSAYQVEQLQREIRQAQAELAVSTESSFIISPEQYRALRASSDFGPPADSPNPESRRTYEFEMEEHRLRMNAYYGQTSNEHIYYRDGIKDRVTNWKEKMKDKMG